MITKTYVEFDLPGAFLSESSIREVASRDVTQLDIPPNAYAFRFYDIVTAVVDGAELRSQPINLSPRYFYGGRVMTRDEVVRELPDKKILLDNMRSNDWDRVIFCRTQNFQEFCAGDIYIPEK